MGRLERTGGIFLFLAGLNLLAGNFGLPISICRAGGLMLLVLVFINEKKQKVESKHPGKLTGAFSWLLFAAGILAINRGHQHVIPVAGWGLCYFAFAHRSSGERQAWCQNCAFSVFFYLFIYTAYLYLPSFQQVILKVSLAFSNLAGIIIGESLAIGPSLSGMWIFFSFTLFHIIIAVRSAGKRRWLRFITGELVLVITLLLFFELHAHFFSAARRGSGLETAQVQVVVFILSLFSLLSWWRIHPKIISEELSRRHVNPAISIIYLILFATIPAVLLFSSYSSSTESSEQRRVTIYAKDFLGSWKVPEFGWYGKYASGMYGLLPEYLRFFGYESNIVTGDLDGRKLAETDVLVIISPQQLPSSEELEAVSNFVESGGGLLVMGDHTDINGTMKPLNTFLAPYGTKFRFDSSVPLVETWLDCLELRPHPVLRGLKNDLQLHISVGASLDVTPPSYPVVIGKYGFSDWGDYDNEEGSFLGDYRQNPGEQLGDVVLASACQSGSGRVIVFGDTTSFQNDVLPYSFPLVANVIDWLAGGNNNRWMMPLRGVVLIVFAFLIYVCRRRVVILSAGLLVFVLADSSMRFHLTEHDFVSTVTGKMAIIDASHGEQFSRRKFHAEEIDGLLLNLMRSSYLPLVTFDFTPELVKERTLVFIIAPTRSFSSKEITILQEAVAVNGSTVIISTDARNKNVIVPLLEDLGLDILSVPLGPVPYETQLHTEEPQFVSAWPISARDVENTESFYTLHAADADYLLVAGRRWGEGLFVLIADRHFLLNRNLEQRGQKYSYVPGNIKFLRAIIERVEGKD